MATSPVAELIWANTNALASAVRAAAKGHASGVVAKPTVDVLPELDDLVTTSLHYAKLREKRWEELQALFQGGVPGSVARPAIASQRETALLHEGLLRDLLSLATEAKKHGIDVPHAGALPDALGRASRRLAEATEALALLDRPAAPPDREQLRLSRESFLGGEGLDLEGALAELRRRHP